MVSAAWCHLDCEWCPAVPLHRLVWTRVATTKALISAIQVLLNLQFVPFVGDSAGAVSRVNRKKMGDCANPPVDQILAGHLRVIVAGILNNLLDFNGEY